LSCLKAPPHGLLEEKRAHGLRGSAQSLIESTRKDKMPQACGPCNGCNGVPEVTEFTEVSEVTELEKSLKSLEDKTYEVPELLVE